MNTSRLMNELDIIVKVINALSRNAKCKTRYASELENFQNRKRQADSNKYRLGVIGVTSSGKSTMINSLLGESLLPAVARPSSCQLVSCFFSQKRMATVFFQDGKREVFTGDLLNQRLIEKYGDEGVNFKNKEKVKQIELSTPEFPFDKNIILIDSPGLDAYGYSGHEQLTMNSLLPTIDFCVFVTTCKTNSDDKMLSVLNTIAEYEKPVVIVQNMIDSLKPSLDGKKTVSDVAQDHRFRIERIISRSNIKDKSKVYIVQISARNALRARQNKLRTTEDRTLLEVSNYKKLVSVVNFAFSQVCPVIEVHRMLFLKKEITRIANAAKEDGAGASGIILVFQYGNTEKEYKAKKRKIITKIDNAIEGVQSRLSALRGHRYFSEEDIYDIKKIVSSCEDEICEQMKNLNESIVLVCDSLNIDYRNVITDFRFDKPVLRLKKKQEVVKDGYWKKGERHWYKLWLVKDDDVWIDTSYTRKVIDVNASIQNAINYINSSTKVFRQTIQRWQKSLEITENNLFAEIENRRSEYEARENQALDCRAYQEIGIELEQIAASIKSVNENHTRVNSSHTDVEQTPLFTINVNSELLPMYRLSENFRIGIQNEIFRSFTGKKNYLLVIGWDEYCEVKFLRYAVNIKLTTTKVVPGINILGNSVQLLHKPETALRLKKVSNKGIYILVNATQIGAAMTEISRLQISPSLTYNDSLYFVVQDFNEIMNGDSVSETLSNIIQIRKQLSINSSNVRYLLLHDNPIFNLAAAEAQTIGCTTQYDEIVILNNLQKKFSYLLPRDKTNRNFIELTIRTILQKLGKYE